VCNHGSGNIVYFDESGFAAHSYRPHGWAKRGVKVHGKITGNHKKDRTNLIMAQRGREWLAPMLFSTSCTHHTVLAWMEQVLLPELTGPSLVVMDNAPFHNKPKIKALLEAHGHTLLPLPTYSPDLNPIEQSFAIIKRRRCCSNQSIENIIMGNY
jgi:transposase